jgi:hypothetical protein
MKNRNFKNVNGKKYYFFTRNEKYILKSVDKSTVIKKRGLREVKSLKLGNAEIKLVFIEFPPSLAILH